MERPFGKYTLVQRLGGGGMAEVFRARLCGPEGFEKEIALKLILPHFSSEPEFVEMFIREATLAAKLDHANIVRIHEFDQVVGRYYIAMELVDGKDLRGLLARVREVGKTLGVPQAVCIALEVCKGLAFAHGELTFGGPEVVHRDISPHNIIISRAGEVKITDFGIAKLTSADGMTRAGVIKGKASYMSPEQARGDPVDTRSDIFSLGCVLWEMLTGQRLFSGDNDLAILKNVQQGIICAPSAYNREVPPDLDAVLLRMLERDLLRRYDSAALLAKDLDRVLSSYPDIGRYTLLSDLFRDLFSSRVAGTEMLPAFDAWEEPEDLVAVEPVGPYAPTVIADIHTASVEEVVPVETVPAESAPRSWLTTAVIASILGGAVLLAYFLFPWSQPEEEGSGAIAPRVAPAALRGPAVIRTPIDLAAETAARPASATKEVEIEQPIEEKAPAGLRSAPVKHPAESTVRPAPKPKAVAAEDKIEKIETNTPVKAPQTGLLSLNAIPWARVYWGKRLLGETPLENIRMPAGVHRLRLVNEEMGAVKTVKVQVKRGESIREVFDLKGE